MIEFEDLPSELPSKTQRKKESTALQRIGARLTSLGDKALRNLPLNEILRGAIAEYNRLPNSHGAKRRQMQYIGRLMREFDIEEIEAAIDRLEQPQDAIKEPCGVIEKYCDRVLLEGDAAINELLVHFSQLERQRLRYFFLEYRKKTDKPDQIGALEVRHSLLEYLRATERL